MSKKKAVVPRLRFPEFRDAGEWEVKNLGTVASLKNGYAFKSSEYIDSGQYKIITIANVQEGMLSLESTKTIAKLPADIQAHQILCFGDILISMTGNVGRVCRVTVENLLLNQRVGKLIPEKINDVFFYQLLQRDEFRNNMLLKAAGGAQGNLSSDDIKGYIISYPCIQKEQQKIADCLSSLDEVIELQAKRLDAIKAHKKCLLQQLFPREGETTPRLRFPEFRDAGPWEVKRLGEVLTEHKLKSSGREEVFSVSIHKGLINQIEHLGRSFAAASTAHYNRVLPGDIVYTKSPTGDFPFGIVKQNKTGRSVIVSPLYGVFSPVNFALGVLIDAFFESPQRTKAFLEPLVQKGAKNTINIKNDRFLSGTMVLPSIEKEQQKIADCLSSLDELIELQAKRLDAIKAHKKGLLQQLFPQEVE